MKQINTDLYLRTAFRELVQFSIPDIGTFRKVYRSASLTHEQDHLKPPIMEVEFDQKVTDSLNLSKYMRNNSQFPAGKSDEIVAAIRQAMLDSFEKRQRYEIDDIGVLKKEENGDLVFIPTDLEKNLFATDFFGLKAVPLSGAAAHVVAMEHQDNLGPMTNTENTKKKTLAASIGWKPVIVVLLFLGVGTLLIKNGPFLTGEEGFARGSKTAAPADSAALTSGEGGASHPADSVKGLATDAPVLADSALLSTESAPNPSDSAAIIAAESGSEVAAGGAEATVAPGEATPDGGLLADAAGERGMELSTRGLVRSQPTDITVLDTLKKNTRGGNSLVSQPTTTTTQEDPTPSVARKSAPQAEEIEAYHLIVGSYSSSQAAAAKVKMIEEAGMRATILFPPAGSAQGYRVSVFSSKDKDQTIAYNQMLKSLGKQTGWVFAKPR